MNWKEFLKPEKRKILISFLLIAITVSLVFIAPLFFIFPFYLLILPFHFAASLFYSIPIYFTVIIFILISYPFGCYIAQNRKWLKGIFFYLITFVVVSAGITFAISGYNDIFGRTCNTDFDCKFICGAGAVNKRFIYLKDPFGHRDCVPTVAFCENNKCKWLSPYRAVSIEDCERIREKKPQYVGECYYFLASQLKDISLCEKIDEVSRREQCMKELKE